MLVYIHVMQQINYGKYIGKLRLLYDFFTETLYDEFICLGCVYNSFNLFGRCKLDWKHRGPKHV